ncbi:hypothetical protein ANCDUO_00672 [Ancylostoma duodenale]|uniref:Uncharacterized protein n=1 Tax=Ancylostoma duodenale TaxID=51022 RepID=A0A0C2E0Y4_9BILA|nr:hypothetical protein ANCDUO_00672 [Ancylostoma duodenale]
MRANMPWLRVCTSSPRPQWQFPARHCEIEAPLDKGEPYHTETRDERFDDGDATCQHNTTCSQTADYHRSGNHIQRFRNRAGLARII